MAVQGFCTDFQYSIPVERPGWVSAITVQPGTGEQKTPHRKKVRSGSLYCFKILKFSGQEKKWRHKAQEYLMPCVFPVLCFSDPSCEFVITFLNKYDQMLN